MYKVPFEWKSYHVMFMPISSVLNFMKVHTKESDEETEYVDVTCTRCVGSISELTIVNFIFLKIFNYGRTFFLQIFIL